MAGTRGYVNLVVYYYGISGMNARDECQQDGGDLVPVNNATMLNATFQILTTVANPNGYWAGGQSTIDNMNWAFPDGEASSVVLGISSTMVKDIIQILCHAWRGE